MLAYEENYSAIEKTCLALVWVTKKLRHYMLAYQVIIISRMDPLKYFDPINRSIKRLISFV